MQNPTEYRYTKDHEWVQASGKTLRVGITEYAQHELGDVVFIDLPAVGATVSQGKAFSVVESVKAASDIYAPISGKVTLRNEKLTDNPELVNSSPFQDGWIAEIEASDTNELSKLMSAEDYTKYVAGISK